MYLTCLNCLNYAGMINGGRGDHHRYCPTKSDFGEFLSQKRIGMYTQKIAMSN